MLNSRKRQVSTENSEEHETEEARSKSQPENATGNVCVLHFFPCALCNSVNDFACLCNFTPSYIS